VLTPAEIRKLAHRGEKDGKVSFWLQPRDYATAEFQERWERIGSGLSAAVRTEEATVTNEA
jgi:hypothetical protein